MGSFWCPGCERRYRVWWLPLYRQERHLRRCPRTDASGVRWLPEGRMAWGLHLGRSWRVVRRCTTCGWWSRRLRGARCAQRFSQIPPPFGHTRPDPSDAFDGVDVSA